MIDLLQQLIQRWRRPGSVWKVWHLLPFLVTITLINIVFFSEPWFICLLYTSTIIMTSWWRQSYFISLHKCCSLFRFQLLDYLLQLHEAVTVHFQISLKWLTILSRVYDRIQSRVIPCSSRLLLSQ